MNNPPSIPLAASLALASLCLAGCLMQASYEVSVTTADGVTLQVPLSRTFKVDAGDDAVKFFNFKFTPGSEGEVKTFGYAFALKFLGGHVPTQIVVEDDTEQPILQLFNDPAPKLNQSKVWVGRSKGFNPADEHINWVNTLDNGVRVYRFTITMTDGSVHIIRAPIFVPGEAKAMFRAELGLK